MAELSNIARPYAEAVFELARAGDDLAGWGDQLDLLGMIAADDGVAALVTNPHVSAEQLQELILGVAGDRLSSEGSNLVRLLVRNGRINALPDIASAYAARRADAESVIEASMTTATEIDARQQEQFAAALKEKLGRNIKLDFEVDEELIGGAVIRAGDWVVDGSVKAQLEQLVGALGA